MSAGRVLVVALVLAGLLAGGGMYYLQVYGFYDRLPAVAEYEIEGTAVRLRPAGFEGIDAASSPLRYRACFRIEGGVPPELAELPDYAAPQPLTAPGWFSCFDARAIDGDLAAGRARAVTAQGNFIYGFDRVMAVYPDGRAYVWNQSNACGAAHLNGDPLPPGCPPAPQR